MGFSLGGGVGTDWEEAQEGQNGDGNIHILDLVVDLWACILLEAFITFVSSISNSKF